MTKKILSIILALATALTICASFVACTNDSEKDTEKEPQKENEKVEDKADYSDYAFAGDSWYRETESCTETIRFGTDGTFSYTCSCGNPVNDADLIEGYTYDEKTKTFVFDVIEATEEMITEVGFVSCDDEKLVLDFDGEERTFVAELDEEPEVDYNKYSFTNMVWNREIDGCTESISFEPYGLFAYYCGCRECVDYFEIADKYTYDADSGIITLNIIAEDSEGISDTFTVVGYDAEELILDFGNGDVRTFTPAPID